MLSFAPAHSVPVWPVHKCCDFQAQGLHAVFDIHAAFDRELTDAVSQNDPVSQIDPTGLCGFNQIEFSVPQLIGSRDIHEYGVDNGTVWTFRNRTVCIDVPGVPLEPLTPGVDTRPGSAGGGGDSPSGSPQVPFECNWGLAVGDRLARRANTLRKYSSATMGTGAVVVAFGAVTGQSWVGGFGSLVFTAGGALGTGADVAQIASGAFHMYGGGDSRNAQTGLAAFATGLVLRRLIRGPGLPAGAMIKKVGVTIIGNAPSAPALAGFFKWTQLAILVG